MFNGKDFSARSAHLDNHNHTNLLQARGHLHHLLSFLPCPKKKLRVLLVRGEATVPRTEGGDAMDEGEPRPPAEPKPDTEQVIELKKKIRERFGVFDREERNACDVREVGTIIRSLNVYPTEKQLQRWIHEIEEEEPTGFIVYDKVRLHAPAHARSSAHVATESPARGCDCACRPLVACG